MKILHVVPNLDYSGTSSQLALLAKHFPATCIARVCCLGPEGPWAARLRQLGKQVDCVGGMRTFDVRSLWHLHQLLRSDPPDVIHAWGRACLRALGLVGRPWLSRTLVCRALVAGRARVGALDRWLLSRVHTVVASNHAEASLCGDAGIAEHQVRVVRPGVEIRAAMPTSEQQADSSLDSKQIICIGAHEPALELRMAVWAFDILRYVFPELRLKMIGDGPQRPYLQWFAEQLRATKFINFLGHRDDAPRLLDQADVCWATGRAGRGVQVVLEAMAAGCPVVATDQPGLDELLPNEQVGYRVPQGDKIALCRHTRRLFLEPGLRQEVAGAARRYVAKHFSPEACAQSWLARYQAAA